MLTTEIIRKRVKKNIQVLMETNIDFGDFYHKLFDYGTPFLIGGAVHDFALGYRPNDLDMVIDCQKEEIDRFIKNSVLIKMY